MPEPSRATVVRWPVPIALAVPALAAAATVTFTAGHSAAFGLTVFGGFAVLTAAAAAVGAAVLPAGRARRASVLKIVVAALGAGAAVIVLAVRPSAGTDPLGASAAQDALVLSLTLAGVFVLLAAIDLTLGIRARRSDRFARDWIAAGVIEALGAVAVLIVPSTFYQPFSFAERTGEIISGALTASTMIVGLFGALTAILGVFLAIAGIGLIPQRERGRRAAA